MRFLQWGVGAATVAVILCLVLGYLGRLHPAGDSFAVFRLQGALALLLLAGVGLLAGMPGLAVMAVIIAGGTGGPLLVASRSVGEPGNLVLYQKNVLFKNSDLAGLEADIRAALPDVVTLQEVSEPNLVLLERLRDVLPYQVFCPFERVGGVAVATRLPVVAGSEVCAKGLAGLQIERPQGRVWLVSVHLHWPWPYGQAAHLDRLLPVIAGLDGPVVVAGDFNMVRWTAALGRVRTAARAKAVGPPLGTYAGFAPLLLLPIDQVMAAGGGVAEVRPLLGSDHLGLLARLTP